VVIHREAIGDPERPRLGVRDRRAALELGPQARERLLHGVVGLVVIEAQAPAQPEQRAAAPVVDVGHRRCVDGTQARQWPVERSRWFGPELCQHGLADTSRDGTAEACDQIDSYA
jgi:hypothetical protein